MKNTKLIKYQASDYYNGHQRSYSDEGDELPYCLEHITSEILYKEFIEDISDDYLLKLKRGEIKRIR